MILPSTKNSLEPYSSSASCREMRILKVRYRLHFAPANFAAGGVCLAHFVVSLIIALIPADWSDIDFPPLYHGVRFV